LAWSAFALVHALLAGDDESGRQPRQAVCDIAVLSVKPAEMLKNMPKE
jgi:hypothetical protein